MSYLYSVAATDAFHYNVSVNCSQDVDVGK